MTAATVSVPGALADLARQWSDTGEAVREAALVSLVHPSLSPQERSEAWTDYRGAITAADDLETGTTDWRHHAGDWETAWLNLCGDVDAALKILMNGTAPGRGKDGELT